MKKAILMILTFTAVNVYSQSPLYSQVKEKLQKEHPELKFENKLLVINIWSPSSAESRQKNAELNKAYTTYEFAKLKGGSKGMIGVMINLGSDQSLQEINLGKDKISKAINLQDIEGIVVDGMTNVIFDSKGNEVKKNVTGNIFTEINNLITR
jgi:hypothetical protein